MADYGVSAAAGQWLTTGFLLTMAVVIPTTGFLLRRFPLRGLFVFALTSFIIGLLLAVVAPTFAVLLLARLLQAVGTAIVLPLLMTTTLTLVPLRHRGMVIGLNSIVISVEPAIGPTVSGVIVNALSWHWIFAAVMPLTIIILVLGVLFIKVPRRPAGCPSTGPPWSCRHSRSAGSALVDGLFDGAHVAFLIGGILASLGVVCALFIEAAPERH